VEQIVGKSTLDGQLDFIFISLLRGAKKLGGRRCNRRLNLKLSPGLMAAGIALRGIIGLPAKPAHKSRPAIIRTDDPARIPA
jgi:hypothetical protein